MSSRARGIRLAESLEQEIEREAARRRESFSSTANSLLTEAIRMRRVPGIVFTDGPTGRRATVGGSGIDVWEVIATWKQGGESWDALKLNYAWLTDFQLRSALAYYRLYPEEIDARLAREDELTPEAVAREYPFLVPRRRQG